MEVDPQDKEWLPRGGEEIDMIVVENLDKVQRKEKENTTDIEIKTGEKKDKEEIETKKPEERRNETELKEEGPEGKKMQTLVVGNKIGVWFNNEEGKAESWYCATVKEIGRRGDKAGQIKFGYWEGDRDNGWIEIDDMIRLCEEVKGH